MGVIYMLLASASFATMSALVKLVGTAIPIQELIFLRCILALPFFCCYLIYQNKPLVVKARKTVAVRAFFGFSAMIGFYYALTHMGLADCIFLGRIQPLFVALLAPFVLGEKTPSCAWLAIMTGLSGVALIMKPALVDWPIAALVALAAALAGACAHLMVRRLNRTDAPGAIVMNFLFLTALASGGWTLFFWVPPSFYQWLAICAIALFASLGQSLMTMAYRLDRAPAVAAASYSSIILSLFYGYFFWGESPRGLVWLGGVLIVCGGALLVKSRIKVSEPARM